MKERQVGPVYALLAALLFGASTPFAKILLEHASPVMLAGLLYLGSGIGLGIRLLLSPKRENRQAALGKSDFPWLSGAILFGGVVAPVLLMFGLKNVEASAGSLLLNLEGVFTALLAWFLFRENFDRRIFVGMVAILTAALLLSWPKEETFQLTLGALPIAGACFAWAMDNNLTRKVAAADPMQIACWKGLVAGAVNIGIAFMMGEKLPGGAVVAGALVVGLASYGVSLTCFVLSLRYLGTARTGAYFSTAPFVGASLSILIFNEMPGVFFWMAAGLMTLGVWLHLSETHDHEHLHGELDHEHEHIHDEHHQHSHLANDPVGEPHSHRHRHVRLLHHHPHYPDIHHQHPH